MNGISNLPYDLIRPVYSQLSSAAECTGRAVITLNSVKLLSLSIA